MVQAAKGQYQPQVGLIVEGRLYDDIFFRPKTTNCRGFTSSSQGPGKSTDRSPSTALAEERSTVLKI